ncbi:MAG: response regulator [Anaerolineae bacterium]|nr:response regulator [Anaerolineae bacterium]
MIKVLIIDDDTNLLNFLTEELTDAGYSVKTIDNGADAIVMAAEQTFDVILLDMLMPGLDGIQVVRVLRKVSPKVPIIGLTGYVGRGYMSQAMDLGVTILTKPVVFSELTKEIEDAIKNKQKTEAVSSGKPAQ